MPCRLSELMTFRGPFLGLRVLLPANANPNDRPLPMLLEESDRVDTVADAAEVRAFLQMLRQRLPAPLNPVQELALRDIVGDNNSPGFIDGTDPLKFP